MTLKALVVGLGQIGMGYDLSLPANRYVLTHARAFAEHQAFSLVGGVDTDTVRRRSFEDSYHRPAFPAIVDAVGSLSPDVVAVAVPTDHHLDALSAILKAHTPKLVLCEKPLSYDREEARRMLDACRAAGCRLFVNYLRRSDPGVREVRRRIDAGEIRLPVKGIVWYSKGLYHNGSHFLDLLQYWLGEVRNFQVVSPGRRFGASDVEPDVLIRFDGGVMHFVAACEENFSHYTVELVAPNGRLRYERGGKRIVWQSVSASSDISGYSVLDECEHVIPSDLNRAQWHVVDGVAHALSGEQTSLCTGDDALRTIEHLAAVEGAL